MKMPSRITRSQTIVYIRVIKEAVVSNPTKGIAIVFLNKQQNKLKTIFRSPLGIPVILIKTKHIEHMVYADGSSAFGGKKD